MAALGTLLGTLFGFLLRLFGRYVVAEKAFKLAAVTSMLILIAGLFVSLKSCVSGVCGAAISNMSSSHHNFAVGLGMAFNTTTYAAVSCYLAVWTLCRMYVLKKRMLALML